MVPNYFMNRLEQQARMIEAFVVTISEEQARWKPAPEQWSILEVVNHLYDEEQEDFRVHLDLILHKPEQPWPRIDPPGWVIQRQYNQRFLKPSLANFLQARQVSLDWLRHLAAPNWEAVYAAPFGAIPAGNMLAAWTAHDLLHLRQFVELHWAYLTAQAAPFNVAYAGVW